MTSWYKRWCLGRKLSYMQPGALGNKMAGQVQVFHCLADCYVAGREHPQSFLHGAQPSAYSTMMTVTFILP